MLRMQCERSRKARVQVSLHQGTANIQTNSNSFVAFVCWCETLYRAVKRRTQLRMPTNERPHRAMAGVYERCFFAGFNSSTAFFAASFAALTGALLFAAFLSSSSSRQP